MKSLITKYAGFILLFSGIIGIVVLNVAKNKIDDEPKTAIIVPEAQRLSQTATTSRTAAIYVDLKGEVVNPGVYIMKAGDRIADLIITAGGLSDEADTNNINMARALVDEMVVIIPRKPKAAILETVITLTQTITVDIKGEVRYPGVYEMPLNSRVADAIAKAGGVTIYADRMAVNEAEIVVDGCRIVIPRLPIQQTLVKEKIYVEIQGEVVRPGTYHVDIDFQIRHLINLAGGLTLAADIVGINLAKPVVAGERIVIKKYQEQTPIVASEQEEVAEIIVEESGLININTADLDALMTLKGIGIVLGQRIIDFRAEYGGFAAIEDIMLVSGIKESIFANIKDAITVGKG